LQGQGSEQGQSPTTGQGKATEPQIPPGTSPANARQIETITERFPPPKGKTAKEQKAIEAGEAACQGKTPVEVREEFYPQAEAQFDQAQKTMIAQLESYERKADRDLSYAAGQLGAAVYEKSLTEEERSGGFQGCVFVLARGLVGRLGGG
jgi:hypothetical protein